MKSRRSMHITASRRQVLQAALCVTPLCASGAALSGVAGCDSKERPKDVGSNEMLELGARAAIERIRTGAMKAEAYVTALLAQYRANRHLNTVITIDEARVLTEARAIDQSRARGEQLGPLCGLPFAVKDQIDVAGYPTTAGNIALQGYVARRSASLIDTMIRHGGIVFAKANCADMVGQVSPGGVTSSNPYFGFVRNPYDPACVPGGSSGGSAAMVAARIVPAAIGEDTGGSVRLPASCCGIAGLRPTTDSALNFLQQTATKRYPSDGMVTPAQLLDTYGPMARTVADVAYLDSVVTGQPTPSINLKDARIGVPRADYWERDITDAGVEKATRAAFDRLREAGAQLVEYDLNALLKLNENGRLWTALTQPNEDLAEWLKQHAPDVTIADLNRLRDSYPLRPVFPPQPALSAVDKKAMVADALRQYQAVFASKGLLAIAFPTLLIPPPLINSNGDTPGQKILVNGRWVDEFATMITNIFWGPCLGAPGLNVPAGLASGLPVGLSLQGLPGEDSRLLGLGIAAEDVLGPLPRPAAACPSTT